MNLIEGVAKRTGYDKLDIEETIQDMIEKGQYLQEIKSETGIIIRANMKMYKAFRNSIETEGPGNQA